MKAKKAQALISAHYESGPVPHNWRGNRDRDRRSDRYGDGRELELFRGQRQVQFSRFSSFNGKAQNSSPRTAEDIKQILRDEMRKWGLRPGNNRNHSAFSQMALREAVDCFECNVMKWSPPTLLPIVSQDVTSAIVFLLDQAIKRMTNDGKRLVFVRPNDLVEKIHGVQIPYPPYSSIRGSLRLNGQYNEIEDLNLEDLDPLKRFTYHSVEAKEALTAEWTSMVSSNKPNHIAEAVAIYEATKGVHACLGCFSKRCMLWNSNFDSSFCNVVCKACGSLYTFWGMSSTEAVMKIFEKGTLSKGRSFAHYNADRNNLGPSSKMFVVLLPVWGSSLVSAYAAEIIDASPALSSNSFNLEKIRIKCCVALNPIPGRRPWFRV